MEGAGSLTWIAGSAADQEGGRQQGRKERSDATATVRGNDGTFAGRGAHADSVQSRVALP